MQELLLKEIWVMSDYKSKTQYYVDLKVGTNVEIPYKTSDQVELSEILFQ